MKSEEERSSATQSHSTPDAAFTSEGVEGVGVVVVGAEGAKCARCWRILKEVGDDPDHDELCRRCVGAVRAAEA